MEIRFKRLTEKAVMPTMAHATDAGFDLTATRKNIDEMGNIVYGTGIAVEIPEGYVGLVFPRSSIANKTQILSNSVGVIDSGYRGEIMAKFKHLICPMPTHYNVGERIAQLIIMPIPAVEFVEVAELDDSDRGTGGYGSTGK
jgi:dUTP pyrophosphatase